MDKDGDGIPETRTIYTPDHVITESITVTFTTNSVKPRRKTSEQPPADDVPRAASEE